MLYPKEELSSASAMRARPKAQSVEKMERIELILDKITSRAETVYEIFGFRFLPYETYEFVKEHVPPGGNHPHSTNPIELHCTRVFRRRAPPAPPDLRPRRRPEIPVGRQRWAALPSSLLSAVF